ncbi:hypothetical protein NFI96_008381 [Prochilodus magdalenae]|nr:hypothetical protein NFI96_008381 [Prochilodus magdalenae]
MGSEEGTTAPLLSQTAEEVWHGPPHPQNILYMYCGEHFNWPHHHLVWMLHCYRAESSAEGGADSPVHHRGSASKPPGFIHQPLPEENQEGCKGLHPPKPLSVLTAAEWEEVPKYKVQNQPPPREFLPPSHQATEQPVVLRHRYMDLVQHISPKPSKR